MESLKLYHIFSINFRKNAIFHTPNGSKVSDKISGGSLEKIVGGGGRPLPDYGQKKKNSGAYSCIQLNYLRISQEKIVENVGTKNSKKGGWNFFKRGTSKRG